SAIIDKALDYNTVKLLLKKLALDYLAMPKEARSQSLYTASRTEHNCRAAVQFEMANVTFLFTDEESEKVALLPIKENFRLAMILATLNPAACDALALLRLTPHYFRSAESALCKKQAKEFLLQVGRSKKWPDPLVKLLQEESVNTFAYIEVLFQAHD